MPRLCRRYGFGVGGEEGADGVADLAVAEQSAAAQPRLANVVGDDGQAVQRPFGEGVEQVDGGSRLAKTAHHEGGSVGDEFGRLGGG